MAFMTVFVNLAARDVINLHVPLAFDLNPATKKLEGDYGMKHRGAVSEKDSMITKENGFENIVTLKPGESPTDYIERLDKKYEAEMVSVS